MEPDPRPPCTRCGQPTAAYWRPAPQSPDPPFPLCGECHAAIHHDDEERLRFLLEITVDLELRVRHHAGSDLPN